MLRNGFFRLPLALLRFMLLDMSMPLARFLTNLKPKRRWTQFSLATVFALVTALCVWLAWCVDRARRQQDAIDELHRLHVAVMYRDIGSSTRQPGVGFGERLFGAAYREPVEYVGFQHSRLSFGDQPRVARAMSLLAELRGLKRLSLAGMPVTDNELEYLKPLAELQKLDLMYTDVSDAGVAELRQVLPECQIVR
jgi:hypothetical protein